MSKEISILCYAGGGWRVGGWVEDACVRDCARTHAHTHTHDAHMHARMHNTTLFVLMHSCFLVAIIYMLETAASPILIDNSFVILFPITICALSSFWSRNACARCLSWCVCSSNPWAVWVPSCRHCRTRHLRMQRQAKGTSVRPPDEDRGAIVGELAGLRGTSRKVQPGAAGWAASGCATR
jgi:hypothetical protein